LSNVVVKWGDGKQSTAAVVAYEPSSVAGYVFAIVADTHVYTRATCSFSAGAPCSKGYLATASATAASGPPFSAELRVAVVAPKVKH
jgi:hypothetical protein